ncbi:ATP-binding cassette domain-containing protein [Streptomyces sp. ST2-7A]|uniref:ATP-binding cassette domain-containing protein n=1 Tax=Streptomyces sp. ST2-7A TaxID=2907214 RepID=UPI001F306B4C|nr:ATP-binding cassette domain-containing protein [Streptomyces sp. ST2-7A]MCE7080930.1 ATP-binding cassette domain-containing protein [Streptomyces sp. ST2-7A]
MTVEVRGLTKRYGPVTAVHDLSFRVETGRVTGFLGPNGAGKSTTMRMILGLDHPSAGTATVDGLPAHRLPNAARSVGALLDAGARHPGRTARDHLLTLARLAALPAGRVDEVLDTVGLFALADRETGGFSLGMGQRLGIAAALLGDPPNLLFDEPINGLDPEGIHWVRGLMRRLAGEGRAVLVSSHLMSEMALTADHLLVIGRGELLADLPARDFVTRHAEGFARVQVPPDPADLSGRLTRVLVGAGGGVEAESDGALRVTGLPLSRVADLAHGADIRLWELSPHTASLEEAYLSLTEDAVEYRSPAGAGAAPVGAGKTGKTGKEALR